MTSGIIRGALYLLNEKNELSQAYAVWPMKVGKMSAFDVVARRALTLNKDIVKSRVRYGRNRNLSCDLIICPLSSNGKPFAVISLSVSTRAVKQQQTILQLLKWGGVWLANLIYQHSGDDKAEAKANLGVDLVTAILKHENSHTASIEIVNQLAEKFNCERVSIGVRKDLQIRLRALSHVASFDGRSELIREIEAAMEEAADQQSAIFHPATGIQSDHFATQKITRANSKLAKRQGETSVLTVPLPGKDSVLGAITLERSSKMRFDQGTVKQIESLANTIAPALEMKQRAERSLWKKGMELLHERGSTLIGSNFFRLKLAILSFTCLLIAMSLVDGNYRVTAPVSIEAASRQVLVAPHEGYVKEVKLRAGDTIEKGQLIAKLDDRNLLLERRKWISEKSKIDNEYQQALAERNRTQVSILLAQLNQVDAEIQMVDDKLLRTELRAPFDGIIVSGDLSQSMGAPVETGQVLYEVAPINSFRVALELNEYDMDGLTADKTGTLIIAALPHKRFLITLDQVIPVAISEEGRNYFRIEASLAETSSTLQPGMRGVAKVDMGKRKLLWIWTHAVVDRISLWKWSTGL